MFELDRNDIKMSKGLAIISMILLHLFCRKGADVYGSPLLWVNDTTPFVYYLGFLAEICVSMYCLCSGYAHYRQGEINGLSCKRCFNRIIKFLINYWIVVVLFSLIGLLVRSTDIPVSMIDFVLNMCLLVSSFNGAWWFVATYVILVCLSKILYNVCKNINSYLLVIILTLQLVFFWIFSDYTYNIINHGFVTEIIARQFVNLMGDVIFSYMVGMLIAKHNIMTYIHSKNISNEILLMVLFVLSIVMCVLHKGIFIVYYATVVFIIFNALKKGKWIKQLFNFLGTHSTNIWLVHMFFYLTLFPGLVQNFKYPLFIFLGMMLICIAVSYIVNVIYQFILNRDMIRDLLNN